MLVAGTRDIFGAGVFDYFLEHGITFDKCYGVSAGCANISSFLAGQQHRNYEFYTEYSMRKQYMSLIISSRRVHMWISITFRMNFKQ